MNGISEIFYSMMVTEVIPFVFYMAIAYLNGLLIKEFGIVNFILFVILTAVMSEHLIQINEIYSRTIPYVIVAQFGFFGPDGIKKGYIKSKKLYYRAKEAIGK